MPVRWAGEQVVETVPVQITKELEIKEVLLVVATTSARRAGVEADAAQVQVPVDAGGC